MNAQDYLPGLGRISLQAGVLVLLVLLAQGIFRRQLTARWRCALWLLVMVRLLLPFSPGSAASIFNLLPPWTNHAVTSAPTTLAPATVTPAAPLVFGKPTPETPVLAIQPAPPSESALALTPTTELGQASLSPPKTSAAPAAVQLSPVGATSWLATLFWVWFAGALLLTGYIAATSLRLAWRCRGLPALTDAAALAVLDECGRRLGVRGRLTVVECSEVASPALFGLFRPRLLLPPGFTQSFSPQELRFVFLHELAHLRRWDLPLNWLVAVLQIFHWFNPLVWFGFARWRLDRELACDALAIEAAGADQHREYGRTILHLLENLTPRTAMPGLVGILENKHQLRRRIGMIANFRPGNRWGLPSVVLLLVLALVGLTDAQTAKPQKPTASTSGSSSQTTPAEKAALRVGADPMPEASATNIELRSLTVTVLDSDGKPLPGAEVHAPYVGDWGKPQPKRLTDENGKFKLRFPTVPKEFRREMSNFGVSVSHKQHVQRSVMWTSSGGDVYAGMPEEVTIKLERGSTIGGVVQDEQGAPLPEVRVLLSGSGYNGFTMGNTERKSHEYSEVAESNKKFPAAVTDTSGRWRYDRFPSDLEKVEVTFVRPDDAQESFAPPGPDDVFRQRPPVSLAELKAQTAITKLHDGVTVRGIVVDENGKPLAGVTIKEGYGHHNIIRAGEFTTDAKGRFERGHRAPRQWIYTASRTDRATVSVVVQVGAGMSDARIVLPPAKPISAIVTDEAGAPLPNVDFKIDPYRTEAQILDWSATTDAHGVVVWTNAPTSAVTFYASSKSLGANRKVKFAPGEAGKRIILSKTAAQKIAVRVKALDAETRQPVKVQAVTVRFEGAGSPFKSLAEPNAVEFTLEIKRTEFRVGMYPSYELKLDATGYETFTTDSTDFDLGDQDLELAFHRSAGANELTVLQPDGQPAAGAKLWVRTTPDGGSLFINAPGRYYGDRLAKEQAGEDGHVKLPGGPADAPVVIAHANGFLDTTVAELKRTGEARLRAYGSVEGRLLVAGKPRSGVSVNLSTLTLSPSLGFHLIYSATTDSDGRFWFTQVPSGEFKLYRWMMPKGSRGGGGRAITETYQMPVTISAGQTNQVEYTSNGRVVIGQVVTDPSDLAVNWQNDVHTLSLKLPDAVPNIRPNREDYATFEAFRKANDASFRSETQTKQARQTRAYGIEIESDGSFRIEDVPPGTYELRIRVTKSDESQQRNAFGNEPELGSVVREVVVSVGKDPLDLGTLTVAMKGVAPAKSSPPVELTALTLDGKPLSLAQFKGKHVLLVFWASWSERSREQLVELQKLRKEFASDSRLVIVSVSLDETAETARKSVEAGVYPWAQGWLGMEGRAKLTTALNVNTLPAVFLFDADGRIVARELEGERLPLTVKRVLAKQ